MSREDVLTQIQGLIYGKRMWLEQHGRKRPEHEAAQKRRELTALEQVESWLTTAIDRDRRAA